MTAAEYDYVIVGAGSAGCIVAARLAEARAGSVLLLEAGDPAERNPESLSADGFKYAFANDRMMWHRMSTPQAGCRKRRLFLGSGRGMGGSGSVNGMVYTRGDRHDFESWPAGWQWDDLEPAFEAVETQLGIQPRPPTAFAQRFIHAAEDAGFRRKDGMNDGDLHGFVGCNDMNYAGDARRSSYRAWLHEQELPGLTIATGARTRRILFDDNNNAIAVEYTQAGQIRKAGIRGELILTAGALETPKLLLQSGVGPAGELQALGIDVVQDAPGVGRNLQDHPNVCLFFRSRHDVDFSYPQVYAFDAAARRPDEAHEAAPDTCFVCYAAPASIRHSMLRMLPILALPGRFYDFKPLRSLLRGLIHAAFTLPPLKRFISGVFGIVVILGKPTARGSIRLASADPDDPALIDPAYYTTEHDRDTLLAGIRKARHIAGQAQLDALPLSDGAKNIGGRKLWQWIHAATMTTFHFCGSCRMGKDAGSPVDTELKVKGLGNVRVADASVIPEIPVSALNAPSMLVGYRAADFILAAMNKREAA